MGDEAGASTPRSQQQLAGELEGPRRIRALKQDVVNKIAAGEIIVAPAHALKELIENAVDAGSTGLEILVKEGGLKLLQITDNGCGINKDDLPILCERFTTSKLKTFEDLQAIGTYGFRGEALASISHIAHLTVSTKTAESSCAWKGHYSAGKLCAPKPGQTADPKPCAGRQGTQITVEDLFYNVPTRRRAFRSASEEYAKIADMVGRYAVHCQGVAFSCKKQGDAGAGIAVPAAATIRDRIRLIHNSALANELVELSLKNNAYGFQAEGLISSANHAAKRTNILLFINHRAVESTAMKKAVEQTYSVFLPKGNKPFIYLSLEIDPARVDVNVHPTKREVNFLNEEEIIELVCSEIRSLLGKVDTSRTFITQSLLGTTNGMTPSLQKTYSVPEEPFKTPISLPRANTATQSTSRKPYENNLVRTDARSRKITTMLMPANRPSLPGEQSSVAEEIQYELTEKEPTTCRLTTIKELRAAVRDDVHTTLSEIFANHTFVGIVDPRKRIAAIQGGVNLYLVDYGLVAAEFFYQLGLTDFGNFGSICFDPPLSLTDLLKIAVDHEREVAAKAKGDETHRTESLDWDAVVVAVHEQLISRREMLAEYFSLELSEDGTLSSIPLLIKGYLPSMAKLPNFLLRLGPHVVWTDEKGCFRSFLRELGSFYVPEPLSPTSDVETEEDRERRNHVEKALENVLFPAFKSRLVATMNLLKGTIEVANLKGLYRVFERC